MEKVKGYQKVQTLTAAEYCCSPSADHSSYRTNSTMNFSKPKEYSIKHRGTTIIKKMNEEPSKEDVAYMCYKAQKNIIAIRIARSAL